MRRETWNDLAMFMAVGDARSFTGAAAALGVPYADRAQFQERTSRTTDTSLPAEERSRLARDGLAYMRELVTRAQAEPGDDILGMLVREHPGALDTDALTIRKGAADNVFGWVREHEGTADGHDTVRDRIEEVAQAGGTPLVVAEHRVGSQARVLGVIQLSDVVKPHIAERFARLRAMGIRTVMVTGDNPLTARAIAVSSSACVTTLSKRAVTIPSRPTTNTHGSLASPGPRAIHCAAAWLSSWAAKSAQISRWMKTAVPASRFAVASTRSVVGPQKRLTQ